MDSNHKLKMFMNIQCDALVLPNGKACKRAILKQNTDLIN